MQFSTHIVFIVFVNTGDPVTFNQAPPSGRNLNVSNPFI